MKYEYWVPEDSERSPVGREVDKCFKQDKLGRRNYERRLLVFGENSYETMVSLEQIKPFRGSLTKLQEWLFDLPGNRTVRVLFVISRGVAYFLHFFIKKSSQGHVTSPGNLQIAEDRAKQFRSEEQREI